MTVGYAGPPQKIEHKRKTAMNRPDNVGLPRIPGLIKVDLKTGKTVAMLPLADPHPTYEVDPENGLLFYLSVTHQIKAAARSGIRILE